MYSIYSTVHTLTTARCNIFSPVSRLHPRPRATRTARQFDRAGRNASLVASYLVLRPHAYLYLRLPPVRHAAMLPASTPFLSAQRAVCRVVACARKRDAASLLMSLLHACRPPPHPGTSRAGLVPTSTARATGPAPPAPRSRRLGLRGGRGGADDPAGPGEPTEDLHREEHRRVDLLDVAVGVGGGREGDDGGEERHQRLRHH